MIRDLHISNNLRNSVASIKICGFEEHVTTSMKTPKTDRWKLNKVPTLSLIIITDAMQANTTVTTRKIQSKVTANFLFGIDFWKSHSFTKKYIHCIAAHEQYNYRAVSFHHKRPKVCKQMSERVFNRTTDATSKTNIDCYDATQHDDTEVIVRATDQCWSALDPIIIGSS